MPEIAEVETVRNILKNRILNKKILDVKIYYKPIVLNNEKEIKENLINKEFIDIKRIGKWLLFETDTHYLLSHLRMEGKYFLKKQDDPLEKHEHVEILFEDGMSMRYHDTRKFGRMKLVKKEELYEFDGIKKQGIEPISDKLTKEYLFSKISKKTLPIKTILLDQTIISGLGNIYADEVLFDAGISPFKKGKDITIEECEKIKNSSKKIITAAIKDGGTTIRSYTSSLGVTGRFQQHLMVHSKAGEFCSICGTKIEKSFVNGRSTYYCRLCQHTYEVSLEQFYLDLLGLQQIPEFLKKYLSVSSLERLKKVGYFCGMDYASKSIFSFKEYISRYDHSVSVALLTFKITQDKLATLSALFHDIATPCFSHVIDYMNGDYINQESTEEYTEQILKKDKKLIKLLKEDSIDLEKIVNFKKFPLVDNNRPKICADRLDGIITSSIAWTQNITKTDIREIINDLTVYKNEEGKEELGFSKIKIAQKILKINQKIDDFCHSKEDTYMMNFLANITKLLIEKNIITYEDLYKYDEEELWHIIKTSKDKKIQEWVKKFETIKTIPDLNYPEIKKRILNPLVNGKRLLN
mgnify:FL=1